MRGGLHEREASGISELAEQAAAQGITYVVSTGDTGSPGCDNLAETVARTNVGQSAGVDAV